MTPRDKGRRNGNEQSRWNRRAPEITATEARQGRHVGLIWVFTLSLSLAVIAGVALGFGWITLPLGA
jgi:hypothetical protein